MALDLTKTGAQLIYDLLNAANPNPRHGAFSPTNVTLGAVSTLTGDVSGKNTKVTVTAVAGQGYSGSQTIKFNRIDINALFIQKGIPALSFPNANYTQSTDFLAYLNSTHSLNLTAADVVLETLPADDDVTGLITYTLQIASTCKTFIGTLPLTITPLTIQLARAFKGNVLNGFVPPDTTRVNLATALTGKQLGLFTVAQLTGQAT
jgi:hypothetical protein